MDYSDQEIILKMMDEEGGVTQARKRKTWREETELLAAKETNLFKYKYLKNH
jgi:hypothetical protein